MSTQPTLYDTTGADASTQQAMAQMIAGNMAQNRPFKVIGPFAETVLGMAHNQNALDFGASSSTNTTTATPTGAAANTPTGNSWWDNVLDAMSVGGGGSSFFGAGPAAQAAAAGSGGAGAAAAAGGANPKTLQQYRDAGAAAKAASTPVTNWIEAHAANWGLIFLGVVLGVGALLISQKDTVINVSKKVGEIGALAA